MAKEGSTVSGLMDSFACAVSLALQHGVPLKLLCDKFAHTRFEPSGWTQNPEIGYAKSIMDYIFRWLHLRFLTGQQQALFDGLRPKYINAPPPGTPEEGRQRGDTFGILAKVLLPVCHPDHRRRGLPPERRDRLPTLSSRAESRDLSFALATTTPPTCSKT